MGFNSGFKGLNLLKGKEIFTYSRLSQITKPRNHRHNCLTTHAHKISEHTNTPQPLEMTAIRSFETPGKRN